MGLNGLLIGIIGEKIINSHFIQAGKVSYEVLSVHLQVQHWRDEVCRILLNRRAVFAFLIL